MEELDDVLRAATAAVNQTYFTLSIAGGEAVFRERVYCYELYHQMRAVWPEGCYYMLTGEVDKRAHPILKELEADGKQPDLLVHRPGSMDDNFAIIEVKHSPAIGGIQKDLHTLDLFVRKVRYKRAIYLVYGYYGTDETASKITTAAKEAGSTTPIEIWLHPAPGESAVMHSKLA
ncbi:hypothetical protein D3C87_1075460 [compost metagenome]|nr:hypothetical protein BKP43_00330 [Variovorax boronicumulans]